MSARLSPEEAASALAGAEPVPTRRGSRQVRTAFEGFDPSGTPITVRVTGPTVVLALSMTCDGCRELADVVREGVAGLDVVGILRLPREKEDRGAVIAYVGKSGRWVLGDDGFEAIDVRSAPFFCVLDERGEVLVEGVAFGKAHLIEHCARALAGVPEPDAVRLAPSDP